MYHPRTRIGTAWAIGLPLTTSAGAQELLSSAPGPRNGGELGSAVDGVGELDGDGRADFVVGARIDGPTLFGPRPGSAYLVSGADGRVLRQWRGEADDDRFGGTAAGVADIDGDGIGDVLLGAPLHLDNGGKAYLYSGATGERILSWLAEEAGADFAAALDDAGDVDGDGVGDVVIGSPGFVVDQGGNDVGKVYVYSGASGELLHSWAGEVDNIGFFGRAVAGPGDGDGDGLSDRLVGTEEFPGGSFEQGKAYLYSGSTGELTLVVGGTRRPG